LLRAVRELIATVTGTALTPAQDRANFIELGLDSLALTQAALALENRFGLRLKLRELVDDIGTIERLAGRIAPLPAASRTGIAAETIIAADASASAAGRDTAAANDVPFGAQARIERRAALGLEPDQRRWLDAFTQRYVERTRRSKEFSQRHRAGMADPRVVTGFNPVWKELVYPIVVERSAGAQMWDVDGNRYIDLLNAFGANILGYQPASVTAALTRQIEAGFEIGPQHPLAADVAALIRAMTGVERVAFCNTGSEAVMGALRIARTVTGRKTIVIFRNSYHGIFDEVIVRGTSQLRSVAAAPGILANAVENVLVLDYGTPAALETIRERAGSLAAVMIEPVQSRAPELQPREFVQTLRALCDESGCALIFDEVITGFRLAPGGAQEFYNVRADIATYGKVIGGGLPLAAIGGRSAWLDALDGGAWQFGDDSRPEAGVTYFAGTFVRHPLALAAAKATLEHLQQRGPALQRSLNERSAALVERLNAFFAAHGAPMRAVGCSSLWSVRIDADQALADLAHDRVDGAAVLRVG
jgi:glutamate-1-semialdehyde aminotransferase/acyl carrier protein